MNTLSIAQHSSIFLTNLNLTIISNAFLNGFWKSLKSFFWCIFFSQILRWSNKTYWILWKKWVELIKQRFLPHLLLFSALCNRPYWVDVARLHLISVYVYMCTDVFWGVKYWLHHLQLLSYEGVWENSSYRIYISMLML